MVVPGRDAVEAWVLVKQLCAGLKVWEEVY